MDLREARYKLNRDVPIPLYYQVKKIILSDLANGTLKQGDKLPAEVEFCECLNLSRPTVRLALNELVAEGILISKKRSGTFVAEPKIELDVSVGIEKLKRLLDTSSRDCTIEVLDLCTVNKTEDINKKLHLGDDEQLIYLKRMWRVGDTPIVYNATYLPKDRFERLMDKDFTQLSLLELLNIHFRIEAKTRMAKIESILASKNDMELLEITRTRASLLYIADVVTDQNDIPVCWSVSRYRGDKMYLSFQGEA